MEGACAALAGLIALAGVAYADDLLHADFRVPWSSGDMTWISVN